MDVPLVTTVVAVVCAALGLPIAVGAGLRNVADPARALRLVNWLAASLLATAAARYAIYVLVDLAGGTKVEQSTVLQGTITTSPWVRALFWGFLFIAFGSVAAAGIGILVAEIHLWTRALRASRDPGTDTGGAPVPGSVPAGGPSGTLVLPSAGAVLGATLWLVTFAAAAARSREVFAPSAPRGRDAYTVAVVFAAVMASLFLISLILAALGQVRAAGWVACIGILVAPVSIVGYALEYLPEEVMFVAGASAVLSNITAASFLAAAAESRTNRSPLRRGPRQTSTGSSPTSAGPSPMWRRSDRSARRQPSSP